MNDRFTMIRLGTWLQDFLADDLRRADLRKIAERGIRLLRIQYQTSKDDPILSLSDDENDRVRGKGGPAPWAQTASVGAYQQRAMATRPELDTKILRILLAEEDSAAIKKIWPVEEYIPIQFESSKEPAQGQVDNMESKPVDYETVVDCLSNQLFMAVFHLRDDILMIFRKLSSKDSTEWEESLSSLYNDDNYCKAALTRLMVSAGGLQDAYCIANSELTKVKRFAYSYASVVMPWDILISKVFFEYLQAGGAQYYAFCERCEKIFFKKRSTGRFCSDSCRVMASPSYNR